MSNYNRFIWDDKRVRLVKDNGPDGKEEVIADVPAVGSSWDFDQMKKQYPVVLTGQGKEAVETVIVSDPDGERFMKLVAMVQDIKLTKQKPLMCVYTATDDYLEKVLGVRLSQEDREFFENHPLTNPEGTPFQDTLRVVQELIDPYGLRISRVQVRPGTFLRGDITQWRGILGCNPLGYADRTTSNDDFLKKLGDNAAMEDISKYRFNHTHEMLYPSISCDASEMTANGVNAWSNGHAQYVPPRRKKIYGAILSFQIDRGPLVPWKGMPKFAAVPPEKEKVIKCFELDDWYKSDFRKASFTTQDWRSGSGAKKTHGGSTTGGSNLPVIVSSAKKPPCHMCDRKDKDRLHTYKVPGICDECWDFVAKKLLCNRGECIQAKEFRHTPPFKYSAFHEPTGRVYVTCQQCNLSQYFTDAIGKPGKRAVQALISATKALTSKDEEIEKEMQEWERQLLRKEEDICAHCGHTWKEHTFTFSSSVFKGCIHRLDEAERASEKQGGGKTCMCNAFIDIENPVQNPPVSDAEPTGS